MIFSLQKPCTYCTIIEDQSPQEQRSVYGITTKIPGKQQLTKKRMTLFSSVWIGRCLMACACWGETSSCSPSCSLCGVVRSLRRRNWRRKRKRKWTKMNCYWRMMGSSCGCVDHASVEEIRKDKEENLVPVSTII